MKLPPPPLTSPPPPRRCTPPLKKHFNTPPTSEHASWGHPLWYTTSSFSYSCSCSSQGPPHPFANLSTSPTTFKPPSPPPRFLGETHLFQSVKPMARPSPPQIPTVQLSPFRVFSKRTCGRPPVSSPPPYLPKTLGALISRTHFPPTS